MSEMLNFKWDQNKTMANEFKCFLSMETMVDVTLACDGRILKAHKVILSACSPYFKSLFIENPCQHPIVVLNDMKYIDLKAVIEFIYCGEINLMEDQLLAVIKVARTLKVKGLGDVEFQCSQSCDESDVLSRAEFEYQSEEMSPEPIIFNSDNSNWALMLDQAVSDEFGVYEPEIKQEFCSNVEFSAPYTSVSSIPLQSPNTHPIPEFQQEKPVEQIAVKNVIPEENVQAATANLPELIDITDKLPEEPHQSSQMKPIELQKICRKGTSSSVVVASSHPAPDDHKKLEPPSTQAHRKLQKRKTPDNSVQGPHKKIAINNNDSNSKSVPEKAKKSQNSKKSSHHKPKNETANPSLPSSTSATTPLIVSTINAPTTHNVSKQQNTVSVPSIVSHIQNNSSTQGKLNSMKIQSSNSETKTTHTSSGSVPSGGTKPSAFPRKQHQTSNKTSSLVSQPFINTSVLTPSTTQNSSTANQMSPQHSQTLTTTSSGNIRVQRSVPDVVTSTSPSNQLQATVTANSYCKIWQGVLEFCKKSVPGNPQSQRIAHSLPCVFYSRDSRVHAEKWPNRLALKLLPLKVFKDANLVHIVKKTAPVVIHFHEESEDFSKLHKLLSAEVCGVIDFPRDWDICHIVICYMTARKASIGLIVHNSDSDTFVHNMMQSHKKYLKEKQMQQQADKRPEPKTKTSRKSISSHSGVASDSSSSSSDESSSSSSSENENSRKKHSKKHKRKR